MASHGLSVVEAPPRPPRRFVEGRRARQPATTAASTPARPSPSTARPPAPERMRTSADPEGRTVLGTLNNCSGGVTPWGTVLSGEENIDQYFEASSGSCPRVRRVLRALRFQAEPERGWGSVDRRFDLSEEPHEAVPLRLDRRGGPLRHEVTPRKHTMLGRFKHEGANVVISRSGHAVAYMGDDEKGEYLYKFVSADRCSTGGTAGAGVATCGC